MNAIEAGQYMKSDRLLSLDAFRGLAIVLMLLAGNQGDRDHVLAPLEHAEWFGCTLADLGFPFFLIIMGAAVPISIMGRLKRGEAWNRILLHAFRRSATLVILGMALWTLHWLAFMDFFRFYGVLQRIALVYLALVIIILISLRISPRYQIHACITIAGGLLILYVLILSGVPSISPSHELSLGQLPVAPEKYHNIVDAVDTRLLAGHLYEYDKGLNIGHDPEGLLSTIPSISTGLFGVLCSAILFCRRVQDKRRAVYLALAGIALLTGGLLSQAVIPFCKNLWTPSFVLYTAGWAYLVLSVLYWAIDIKGLKRWAGLLVMYGQNPIIIFFAAACLMYLTAIIRWTAPDGKVMRLKQYLYEPLVSSWADPIFGPYVASAIWGLLYMAIFGALARWLSEHEIYVKI